MSPVAEPRCTARIEIVDGTVRCRNCGDDLGPLKADLDDQFEQVTPTGSCWPCVFGIHVAEHEEHEPTDEEMAAYQMEWRLADPCPECGEAGACAYDAEGRPLVHVIDEGDDS